MGLLLDLLSLEVGAPGPTPGGGGASWIGRYVCGHCRADLWDGEDCSACAARIRRHGDEMVLTLLGAL